MWMMVFMVLAAVVGGCGKPTEPKSGGLAIKAGDILVTGWVGSSSGVFSVSPATGAQSMLLSDTTFIDLSGIAISPEGDLYVADEDAFSSDTESNGGAVFRGSRATGAKTVVFRDRNLYSPLALTVAPSGLVYFTCFQELGGTAIVRLDPATGASSVLTSRSDNAFSSYGIAVAASGHLLVAVKAQNGSRGGVLRVDAASGGVDSLTWGDSLQSPVSLAVDGDGNVIVVDMGALDGQPSASGPRLFRVSPDGVQTVMTSGGWLVEPWGITVSQSGDILVYDDGNGFSAPARILRIHPVTGAQSVVASLDTFSGPSGIVVVP
jgi:sugar lactone lactonase YvrE